MSVSGNTAHLSGPLSFATVPELLLKSASWFNGRQDRLTVDLSDVPMADSAGLALLLEWLSRARARNLSLHFTGIDRQVAEIIRANGLSELLVQAAGS